MSDLAKREGFEKQIVKDPTTGKQLWRMTYFPSHDIQPYYDISSWSPDGEKIVFSSVHPEDLVFKENIAVSDKGYLFIMNADGTDIECLATDVSYDSHVGCFPVWIGDSNELIYRKNGKSHKVNIYTKEQEVLGDGGIRQVSPDGEKAVYQNEEGVFILDLDTLNTKKIVGMQEIIKLLPSFDEDKAHDPEIPNLKWNPDGSCLMGRFSFSPGEYMKSLYVFNADGSNLHRLKQVSHSFHHHSWHPDGETIVLCDKNESNEYRHYFINKDGTNKFPITDEQLGGHPKINPDGTKIVTDISKYGEKIVMVDIPSEEIKVLASYEKNLKRTHAHPSWNRDGTQVIYHSDHTGYSEIYIIPEDALK